MPTYEYQCQAGHNFERFQKISDDRVGQCPECGAVAERKISGGQGLIFKGSGFYITDYGKDGKGPRKEPGSGEGGEKKSDSADAKTSGGGDAKADAKPAVAKEPAKPKVDSK
jgi:putative FmdB family regulatory protein